MLWLMIPSPDCDSADAAFCAYLAASTPILPGNSGKLKNRIATNPRLPLSGLKVVVLEGAIAIIAGQSNRGVQYVRASAFAEVCNSRGLAALLGLGSGAARALYDVEPGEIPGDPGPSFGFGR